MLFVILHGPVTVTGGSMGHVLFPYWLRQLAFYAIVLVYLPLLCGLMPFAGPDSPVMKLMNSDTHSWTISFASLDILGLAGKYFFIIHLTFAIGRRPSWSLDEVSEMLSDDGLPVGLTWVLFAVMIS
nr:protein CPR-5 [Tanacetum cinerariifolium]